MPWNIWPLTKMTNNLPPPKIRIVKSFFVSGMVLEGINKSDMLRKLLADRRRDSKPENQT